MSVENSKIVAYLDVVGWVEAETKQASGSIISHSFTVTLATATADAAGLTKEELNSAIQIGKMKASQSEIKDLR